jgi:hypothetical protein
MGRATQMESRPRHGSIPQAVQAAVRARLEQHVRAHWKDRCREVVIRFRGKFAYSNEKYEPSFLLSGAPAGTPRGGFRLRGSGIPAGAKDKFHDKTEGRWPVPDS